MGDLARSPRFTGRLPRSKLRHGKRQTREARPRLRKLRKPARNQSLSSLRQPTRLSADKGSKAKAKEIKKACQEPEPKFIKATDQALVDFEPQKEMSVTTKDACPGLGRVAVLESNSLVMLGKITDVTYDAVADRS